MDVVISSFHSIGIPSEWGPICGGADAQVRARVSIQLGSPASGDETEEDGFEILVFRGFHSIGIPSEWGLDGILVKVWVNLYCFHSIGIPSEWGQKMGFKPWSFGLKKFPFNWDPQRVGTKSFAFNSTERELFPFNWDPQRVGTIYRGKP